MWPWEHLLFGYALYRGWLQATLGRRPEGRDVLVLAFATQCPDLVDKPLAWTFGVLPSGLSLGHSLLFATSLSVVVSLAACAGGRPFLGVAFTVGYVSHLVGDVLFGLLTTGRLASRFLFWPFLTTGNEPTVGLVLRTSRLMEEFLLFLSTPRGALYLAVETTLIAAVLLVWASDGFPGTGYGR